MVMKNNMLFVRKEILLSLLMFFFASFSITASADDIKGYPVTKGTEHKKAIAINCYDDTNNVADQSLCDRYSILKNTSCEAIESTLSRNEPMYMCNAAGEMYCMKDTDCQVLGKNTCVISKGSSKKFEDQFTDDDKDEQMEKETDHVGICVSLGGTSESNAFGQAICNAIKIITGSVGRAISGVAFIVLGIMFFFGKVTWGLVLAIVCGMAAIFGYDSIVTVITGKPFRCN